MNTIVHAYENRVPNRMPGIFRSTKNWDRLKIGLLASQLF